LHATLLPPSALARLQIDVRADRQPLPAGEGLRADERNRSVVVTFERDAQPVPGQWRFSPVLDPTAKLRLQTYAGRWKPTLALRGAFTGGRPASQSVIDAVHDYQCKFMRYRVGDYVLMPNLETSLEALHDLISPPDSNWTEDFLDAVTRDRESRLQRGIDPPDPDDCAAEQ
jgi:hypothetical protein